MIINEQAYLFLGIMNRKSISRIAWTFVALLSIVIKSVSYFPAIVEKYYTYGIYPIISRILRILLGWIPFSIGDIFYSLIIIWLIRKIFILIKRIKARQINRSALWPFVKQFVFIFLWIYVIFYGLWGLNYSRTGISAQLSLAEKTYTTADLDTLTTLLQQRLNQYAGVLTPTMRNSLRKHKNLFNEASKAYKIAEKKYPFLQYSPISVKPSIFSYLGNYLGFQGYYNPFSGEAQVNTTIPSFEEPFVTTHEIAHQLGYGKENEANFVGFLACRLHPSPDFKYSVYYDMYHYSIGELYQRDSVLALRKDSLLHPQVLKDRKAYREFYKKYRNPFEPVITWAYSHFLKANNQPNGKETYDEVVVWLVAYYKKYNDI
ncbi:MAG: DUF3810 domain-containing protein [Niabella sp.]